MTTPLTGSVVTFRQVPVAASRRAIEAGTGPCPASSPGSSSRPRAVAAGTVTCTVADTTGRPAGPAEPSVSHPMHSELAARPTVSPAAGMVVAEDAFAAPSPVGTVDEAGAADQAGAADGAGAADPAGAADRGRPPRRRGRRRDPAGAADRPVPPTGSASGMR